MSRAGDSRDGRASHGETGGQSWVQILFEVFALVYLECQMGRVYTFGTILFVH